MRKVYRGAKDQCLILFFSRILVFPGFGLARIVWATESDPCNLLRDPKVRMMLSGALETKLMIQCGEITEEQLGGKRRDVSGDADVAPPFMGEAPGTDFFVNNPASDSGGTTQSETTIVAVGNILCAAWNDSGEGFGANGFIGFGFSDDGGITWSDGGNFPSGPSERTGGHPSLAYSKRDKVFYYVTLSQKGVSLWKSINSCQS